ncbi:MAG: alpha-galactosidase [Eubacteriales bacterium]|nr:alpha-galactosidase [Eubacteriales bacterium]
MNITLRENGLYLDILITPEGDVRLLNLSDRTLAQPADSLWFRLTEVQESGQNQDDNCGSKHTGTQPGSLLRYDSHTVTQNEFGTKLEVRQRWRGLFVISHFQFYTGIPAVRSWTELQSREVSDIHPIEYVTSFKLAGLGRGEPAVNAQKNIVHIPHSSWCSEAQWRQYTLEELGCAPVFDEKGRFSMKRVALASTGTWPAGEHLPMGAFSRGGDGRTMAWQLETAGSWNWELSDSEGWLYLALSGPSAQENGFTEMLRPGETFVSVPCAIAFGGNFEESIQALTRYRRRIRRPNQDNAHPSVIYNDYMNCLWGDPTTEKERPLIRAAQEAGCKIYCVDCGWYSEGYWWDGVGEWLPSGIRFPGGITEVMDDIRAHGMIPGLWLELEVMGTKCPLAKKVPPSWFFQRNGKPIVYRSRYQLDFRNPEVIRHADGVIDRLVNEYGVGYIKMDYNINAGPGTDYQADNVGAGLLGHTRAYLKWLDGVLARYPDLIIENCGSGGMRMEYSLLSRLSIQSVSDQEDYRKMAALACNCATALTPEQAAIWSYPLPDGDEEETIFNMVNAMLLRIHQSGHLQKLSPARLALVQEGIACHKSICDRLKDGLPCWPIGLGSLNAPFLAFGVDCGDTLYLSVWHVQGSENVLSLPLTGRGVTQVKCLYPAARPVPAKLEGETLTVELAPLTARVFELKK